MHTPFILPKRSLFALPKLALASLVLCALQAIAAPADTAAQEAAAWAALRSGAMVLFRHANAPGVGDPPGMQLADCASQRNLDDAGRQQARQMGERLRQHKVPVAQVMSSQWCRTLETARLMDMGPVQEQPVFNSTFADRSQEPAQTLAAQKQLLAWRSAKPGGSLVVVTHQVNISAISGDFSASAEGVVVRRKGAGLEVVGRIAPPALQP